MKFEVLVIVRIINPKGRLVKEHRFKSRSFLLNYAKIMGAILGMRSDTAKNEAGVETAVYGYCPTGGADTSFKAEVKAGEGDDSYGIVIGLSDTPVSIEDYALGSKITHGTGTNQMEYKTCSVSSVSYTPDWARVIISRDFLNLSKADIEVKEIGLMIHNYVLQTSSVLADFKGLILRDVLPSPDIIPDGYTYSVSYEIRWVV